MPFAAIPDAAALARAIVDTIRDPLLVLDQELRIVAASRAFYQTFQLVDQDIRRHLIYEIEDGQWNIPELRTILETIAKDHARRSRDTKSIAIFPALGGASCS